MNHGGNNPARPFTPPTSTLKAFARHYRKRAKNVSLSGEGSEWLARSLSPPIGRAVRGEGPRSGRQRRAWGVSPRIKPTSVRGADGSIKPGAQAPGSNH